MTGKASPEGIIAHMNKDHKHALEDYLFVYGSVPITDKIAYVRLSNIELDHMTLQFNHFDVEFEIEKPIPFEPPLQDWSEARTRLVTMAKEAAAKRNLSHLQINEMRYPSTLYEYTVMVLVFTPLICYYNRSLLSFFPEVLRLFLDNDRVLLSFQAAAFLIHLGECLFLLKPRLDFHRVQPDFLIEWYLFGMLEGFPTVKRFDRLVNEKMH